MCFGCIKRNMSYIFGHRLSLNTSHMSVSIIFEEDRAGILIIYSKELFRGEKGDEEEGDIKTGIIDMKSYRSSIKWNT